MADAPARGAGGRKLVEVQVLSSAPTLHGLIVQRIGQRFPKPLMGVRFPLGLPLARPCGGNGRRKAFKMLRGQPHLGSTPSRAKDLNRRNTVSAEKMIVQYLRDPKTNVKRGVALAIANDKFWSVGVSLTNLKAGDKFNAGHGIKMAHGRAVARLEKYEKHTVLREQLAKKLQEMDWGTETASKPDLTNFAGKVPVLQELVVVPASVWPQVAKFVERAQRYFKEKKGACRYEATGLKTEFEQAVQRLEQLFETDQDENQRRRAWSSLREEAVTMSQVQHALEVIGKVENQQQERIKVGKHSNKVVTRVTKP